jgi:hypothetical protein
VSRYRDETEAARLRAQALEEELEEREAELEEREAELEAQADRIAGLEDELRKRPEKTPRRNLRLRRQDHEAEAEAAPLLRRRLEPSGKRDGMTTNGASAAAMVLLGLLLTVALMLFLVAR